MHDDIIVNAITMMSSCAFAGEDRANCHVGKRIV